MGVFNYKNLDSSHVRFFAVAPVSELPNGERMFLEIDNRSIVMFNIAGEYYAIEDVCSHDDGPLGDGEIEGFEIVCPRHGARFDLRTGEVLALPAVVDIPAYPLRIVDGMLEIGLPVE